MVKLSVEQTHILINNIFNIYGTGQSFLKLFNTDTNALAVMIAQTELHTITDPTLANLQNNFDIFFIGTLLERMRLIVLKNLKKYEKQPSLAACYKTASKWMTDNRQRLFSTWLSRRQGLAWAKDAPKYDKSCDTPLSHSMQFGFVVKHIDEKYATHASRYMPLQYRPESMEERTDRLHNSSLLLRNGPSISSGNSGLTRFFEQVTLHSCGLIIACGFSYAVPTYVVFPDFHACSDDIDFQNYFAATCPEAQKAKTKKVIAGFKAVNPTIDEKGNSVYLADRYSVTTYKQHAHTVLNDDKNLWQHELNTYVLNLKTDKITVPPVIVHNILIPDSNPAKLNRAQLELIYKSVVKTIVEGRKILIHCAAGVGRTGEMAFILARLLIKEMPQNSIAAIKWLRQFRPGLVANYEQLADAEKLSVEMLAIHQQHLTGIGKQQNQWRYVYEKLNLKTWIVAVPFSKVQSAVTAVAANSTNAAVFWQQPPALPPPPLAPLTMQNAGVARTDGTTAASTTKPVVA